MTATKSVRITVRDVHDGLGGVHHHGDIVEFDAELADFLISRGQAERVQRAEVREAVANAVDMSIERNLREVKSQAEARQAIYDSLPPEVRALAREHGDDVVRVYLDKLEQAERRRRGLPAVATHITADAGFEQFDDPPKRKRGRPRKDETTIRLRSVDGDHGDV
jgi:hypothetical protein